MSEFWPPHDLPLWERNATWLAEQLTAAGFCELPYKHREFLLEEFAGVWQEYALLLFASTNLLEIH